MTSQGALGNKFGGFVRKEKYFSLISTPKADIIRSEEKTKKVGKKKIKLRSFKDVIRPVGSKSSKTKNRKLGLVSPVAVISSEDRIESFFHPLVISSSLQFFKRWI